MSDEIYVEIVSISENDFVETFQFYPNPVNDVLNVETEAELKSVEIYNIQGQKVKSATHKQVNVSDLASGTYMVKIQEMKNIEKIKKIIKE